MWPYLFGSGWVWDVLLSAGVIAGIVVAIAVLLAPGEQPRGYREAAHDRLQTVWHAYEQGDLTDWEFALLNTPRPAMRPQFVTPAAAVPAAAATAPAGEPAEALDAAAD
jgi:hypothetical protein